MILPNHLLVSIYNSAGERVRTLFQGESQGLPASLEAGSGSLIPGQTLWSLSFPGALTGHPDGALNWDGSNDNGQWVTSGLYSVKAEFTDPFGKVTALVTDVQALTLPESETLSIFNSAGEIVRILHFAATDATDFSFVGPDDSDPSYQFKLLIGSAVQLIRWDGNNAEGTPVQSGTYMATLFKANSLNHQTVVSHTFTVLREAVTPSLGGVRVGPNPRRPGQDLWILVQPSAGGENLHADIFSLDGTKVADVQGVVLGGRLRLLSSSSALAPGVYLVSIERLQAKRVLERRWVKLGQLEK